MALALFDLDNTLLNGDSDHSWGIFLAEIGVVDAAEQRNKQDKFYQQYVNGKLDIIEFCEYQFRVLRENSLKQLQEWHAEFMHIKVEPMILSGKADLLSPHQDAGDDVLIITATCDFVTAPIANRLGVDTLLATQAELLNGRYTGKVAGTPCFKEGKISRLKQWLNENDKPFENSCFYSDSVNDLPLLELVDTPVAVTPDDNLRNHATKLHWKIID